jgi:excinuclease ABC subunit A
MQAKSIKIHGAKLNNLKNVSVEIPHNKFTVITGVSGSGKSSLAFDTLFAEGQRRFVESLSAYARQFLERMNRPDVELISGLPPAIAIEQNPSSKNPRSTVGTTTEVYDYIRLLYGRIGKTICRCGRPVQKDSPDTIMTELKKLNDDDKLYVMFPLTASARNIRVELETYKKLGFTRFVRRTSDVPADFDDYEPSAEDKPQDIFILVDRLVFSHNSDTLSRLAESVEAGLREGGGHVTIRNLTTQIELRFSSHFECPDCDIVYEEPEPRLFSFNNPYGACPNCQGFGRTIDIDEDLVIPDKYLSLRKGAIAPFRSQNHLEYHRQLLLEAPKRNIPIEVPYCELSEEQQRMVWEGFGNFIGINGFFTMLDEKSYKVQNRVMLARYRGYTRCKACGGSRIRTSARQVFFRNKNIPELIKMPLGELLNFFDSIELSEHEAQIASQVIKEIRWRLRLLVEIGLDYLTLDRLSHTLSGGEMQRINLSTALGSALVGTLYVLDEPSIGMHPRDTKRLVDILFKLRNLGNTIVVVEHDPDIILCADKIIDMGPAAGSGGGEVMFSGTSEELLDSEKSLTGLYLSGKKQIPLPEKRISGSKKSITITRPRDNNLKIQQVSFPLGCMVVVTGVSGSGKSTLIHNILYEGTKRALSGLDKKAGLFDTISGIEHIKSIEMVDQSSIGKSSRSTPVTYTKAFDLIRELFASTQAARQFGYKPGYFSFNVPGGRCETCEGEGKVTVDMQFLPDVHLECEACKGTRYKKEARSILFHGKSIVDVLKMTVDEALEFFQNETRVAKKLQILQDVGLGYLCLGQPSTMLSGGESQRIKLATHLETNGGSDTLFIFDEPTTGLHLDDISKLIYCFRRLIQKGNSVIIIEHNLNIIASADWLIDLGPEGGNAGGEIVAVGTPEDVMKCEKSYTGAALKDFFKRNKNHG